jgi:sugar lactone lactonase YvrE
MQSLAVECVVRGSDLLGECPIWDDASRTLWWVDVRAPALKRFDPATAKVTVLGLTEAIGSFGLRAPGKGMIAAMHSGLYLLDPVTGSREVLAQPEAHLPNNRFNDGRCDRAGRYWAGTMSKVTREPTGSLYRLDPDGRCKRMRGDIIIPNSVAWSPDDGTMYFADTPRQRIWAFDFDIAAGEIANERVLAETPGPSGGPDGSCVDAEGCLWNAEYGRWRIVRYTPRGEVDRVVPMPAANPTCCCFGGPRLDTLYVTSATQRLTPEELAKQPLAGSVFALSPGVRGLPEARFAG